MKLMSPISSAFQVATGVALGVSAYAIPVLIIFAVTPRATGPAAMGLATAFAIALPIILIAIVIFALIVQVVATLLLTKWDMKPAVLGVWLSYPIMAVLAGGFYEYRNAQYEAQFQQASKDISLSRKLTHPSKEIRTLVLANMGRCRQLCAAILKAGIVDSVAVRSVDGYVRNELAGSKVCKDVAAKISQNRMNRLRNRGTTRPTLQIGGATSLLESAGYFDECIITMLIERKYYYDIKIVYRRENREPSNNCCYVAEIFENVDGDDKLLGRWLKGWGELSGVNAFEVSDIIAELTGKPVNQLLAPHQKLKPFPITSLEEELARLAGFTRNGAYISNWETFLRWVQQVLNDERQRQKRQVDKADRQPGWDRLHVSDTAIDHLVAILSNGPAGKHEPDLKRFSAWMAADSKQRLEAAWKRVGAQ